MSISPYALTLNGKEPLPETSSVKMSFLATSSAPKTPLALNADSVWNSSAAEELSMQFSEVMEARQQTLEERIEKSVEPIEAEPSIKEIQQVMKLLEGREGFQSIHNRAYAFAKDFLENPDHAEQMLRLSTLSTTQKYATLRLAMESLEKIQVDQSPTNPHLELSRLLDEHSASDTFTKALNTVRSTQSLDEKNSSKLNEEYFQLLASQPSLQSIWSMVTEKSAAHDLMSTLSEVQRISNNLIPTGALELIGKAFMVNRLVQAVRTMLTNSKLLLDQIGLLEPPTPDLVKQCASFLIDLTHTTVSSSLLDKFSVSVLNHNHQCIQRRLRQPCTCRDTTKPTCLNSSAKPYFFSLLHRLVHRWPEELWGSSDIQKSVANQLIRKQNSSVKWMRPTRSI